jgi:hypothetical protein
MTMSHREHSAAVRPGQAGGGGFGGVLDDLLHGFARGAARLFSRVGLAVAAGRFSSSSGGIGPWQC